jgi:hypothetical protein
MNGSGVAAEFGNDEGHALGHQGTAIIMEFPA